MLMLIHMQSSKDFRTDYSDLYSLTFLSCMFERQAVVCIPRYVVGITFRSFSHNGFKFTAQTSLRISNWEESVGDVLVFAFRQSESQIVETV